MNLVIMFFRYISFILWWVNNARFSKFAIRGYSLPIHFATALSFLVQRRMVNLSTKAVREFF